MVGCGMGVASVGGVACRHRIDGRCAQTIQREAWRTLSEEVALMIRWIGGSIITRKNEMKVMMKNQALKSVFGGFGPSRSDLNRPGTYQIK